MVTKIDTYVINKVKARRKELGVSQANLAFELGYADKTFINKAETGKYGKKYNVSQLNEIAKILKCSIRDFFPEKPM